MKKKEILLKILATVEAIADKQGVTSEDIENSLRSIGGGGVSDPTGNG